MVTKQFPPSKRTKGETCSLFIVSWWDIIPSQWLVSYRVEYASIQPALYSIHIVLSITFGLRQKDIFYIQDCGAWFHLWKKKLPAISWKKPQLYYRIVLIKTVRPSKIFISIHCPFQRKKSLSATVISLMHSWHSYFTLYRGRILGRNWDKSLKSLPPCYSQSPLLTNFTPPSPWSKVVWNWFVMYVHIG